MLGIQQRDYIEAVVQGSFRSATLDLQPALLKINSACETQNEKLDRFEEVQTVRQGDVKQNIQEQTEILNTSIHHSGREVLHSIREQLATVTNMSTQQFKSIEGLLLQLQQDVNATVCYNNTEIRKRHDDTSPKSALPPNSDASFNSDEQRDVAAKKSTHIEVLESICRLSRLAAEKQRTSFSKEAQDVIEDMERLFDLGDLYMRPSAQALGKRKRTPEENNLLDDQRKGGLRKSRSLLRACSSVALNQSIR